MSDRPFATRFAPGFVGTPGNRTFLIEVDDVGGRVWYVLEKAQVAAFAEQAANLLDELELSGSGEEIDLGAVSEPTAVAFRIGQIVIEIGRTARRIDLTLIPVDPDDPSASHTISAAQLDAAVRAARLAIPQGRRKCPRCGLAMDPEGHACPVMNGDLRHHRP